MEDISSTIVPKSDQLNADDLIAGPRIIKITAVKSATGDKGEKGIAIHFEGDDDKPYKPCKSMRRVLVWAWGPKSKDYIGQSLKLYRDPNVMFGGVAVGGIRISHMTGIDCAQEIALTETRGKRKPFRVSPLAIASSQQAPPAVACITNAQRSELAKAVQRAWDVEAFLTWLKQSIGVASTKEIPASEFKAVMEYVEARAQSDESGAPPDDDIPDFGDTTEVEA